MKLVIAAWIVLFLLGAGSAAAQTETMPDEMLQKDYDNCMGGETAQKSPQRAQYCGCVRNGMRSWTVDQYGEAATAAQQTQQPTESLSEITKKCLSQALAK